MHHPFADLIDLRIQKVEPGTSTVALLVETQHLNPHGVAHGAVLYALADTGMGSALYPTLGPDQICATIEIKMNYFKPVAGGEVICKTELVNRGNTVANPDSRLYIGELLVAQANGNYAIFRRKRAAG